MFLIALSLVKGSTIRLLIDSNGKKAYTLSTIGSRLKISNFEIPYEIFSTKNQTNRKPIAKAERFIKTPTNKQKEKNPRSLTK